MLLYAYDSPSKSSSAYFFVVQTGIYSFVIWEYENKILKNGQIFDSFFENILTGGSIWQIKKWVSATRGGYHVRKFETQRIFTKKISP